MNAQKIEQIFLGYNEWLIAGGYFKLLALGGNLPVTVQLFKMGKIVFTGTLIEAGFYQRVEFDRVAITTPASEAVAFVVAGGEGGYDRLVGDVSVIDGSASITKAGRGFIGATSSAAAAAGKIPISQLFNPAGSGVNCFIKKLSYFSFAPSPPSFVLDWYDTVVAAGSGGVNKKTGGAVSQSLLAAVESVTELGSRFAKVAAVAGVSSVQTFEQPLQLTPGTGLCVASQSYTSDLTVTYDFYEEAE